MSDDDKKKKERSLREKYSAKHPNSFKKSPKKIDKKNGSSFEERMRNGKIDENGPEQGI